MAQRQPLREIEANRRTRRTFTPSKISEITGAAKCGISYAAIGREYDIDRSVVRKMHKRITNINTNHGTVRAGRRSKCSPREQAQVVSFARDYPKASFADMRQELRLDVCDRTIKRILLPHGIKKCQYAKRPELSEKAAENRY